MYELNVETAFPHTMIHLFYALFSRVCLHASVKACNEHLFHVSTFNDNRLRGPLHKKLVLYWGIMFLGKFGICLCLVL